jgi:methionyl-tRNA formyltransferase
MINISFFGTSDRSISILETLINDPEISLKLCVTKNDTKVGRKQETRETEVKKWALAHSIPLFTTDSLKKDSANVAEIIKTQDITLGIVADFSFIIPEEVFSAFPRGMINIHFSLLPKWRGASPVQFAILNGDITTGITYHLVASKLDNGDIISQIGYKMSGTETSGSLYEHLFPVAARNLPNVIKNYIAEMGTVQKQDDSQATYTWSPSHPKSTFIYKEDAKIDWTKSPVQIEQAIRAYDPWPIAWTTLGELAKNTTGKEIQNKETKIKIFSADISENKLRIKTLQVEGKKVTDWNSFANGYLR